MRDTKEISAVGATQLLFDVLFWGMVFEGAWKKEGGDENAEENPKDGVESIVGDLRAKVRFHRFLCSI